MSVPHRPARYSTFDPNTVTGILTRSNLLYLLMLHPAAKFHVSRGIVEPGHVHQGFGSARHPASSPSGHPPCDLPSCRPVARPMHPRATRRSPAQSSLPSNSGQSQDQLSANSSLARVVWTPGLNVTRYWELRQRQPFVTAARVSAGSASCRLRHDARSACARRQLASPDHWLGTACSNSQPSPIAFPPAASRYCRR
jgi:hypothetical protein